MKQTFTIKDKHITIFQNDNKNSIPAVYLHVYQGDGSSVWELCQQLECPDFTLIAIGNLDWNKDMTPWPIPSVFPNDGGYAGEAKQHLLCLTDTILPTVHKQLSQAPSYEAIAGYSLGGLFAIYTAYHCAHFSRVASMSGSLWYPDFLTYATTHNFLKRPDYFYLSLGNKEKNTRNPILSTVEEHTQQFEAFLSKETVPHILEMNPGNHFKEADLRTAKGIKWLLSQ